MDLNPKVRAALIAAVVTAAVSIVATLADVYPDNVVVKLLALFVPVIAGYLKTDTTVMFPPLDAPAADGDDAQAGAA